MHEPWHTGQTLLMFASSGNRAEHLGVVDMLLQRGATVNQQDEKGPYCREIRPEVQTPREANAVQ